MNVKSICAAMLMAALATGAAAACEQMTFASDGDNGTAQPFITKEWNWSDEVSNTTFSANGPPQQVNALDPENGIVQCPDCELISSVQFGPQDQVNPDRGSRLGLRPINIPE